MMEEEDVRVFDSSSRLEYDDQEMDICEQEKDEKSSFLDKIRQGIEMDNTVCVVCMENLCSILFIPCNHIVTCQFCASKLQNCPLCKSKIDTAFPGLSSFYSITSDILENHLIFGRAIFTADQTDIFNKNQKNYMMSITKETLKDKLYLWFPHFCHQITDKDLGFPCDVTGVIVLEGLNRYGITQTEVCPIGILVLKTKQLYVRRSIVLRSFITNLDLKTGNCQIVWFTKPDFIKFANHIHFHNEFSWPYLIYETREYLSNYDKNFLALQSCPITFGIIHDTSEACSKFQSWINKSGLLTEGLHKVYCDEKGEKHSLTQLEKLWLGMHSYCRINKKFLLHSQLFNQLLDDITVTTCPVDPRITVDKITHEIAVKCAAVSVQNDTTNQLMQALQDGLRRYNQVRVMYKDSIGVPIDGTHHTYRNCNLFITQEIDKTIRDCISSAPVDPFNDKEVKIWCKYMRNIIKERFDVDNFYQNVISDIVCIERKSAPFLLYGMLETNLNTFLEDMYAIKRNQGYDVVMQKLPCTQMLYRVVSGKLSTMPALHRPTTVNKKTKQKIMKPFFLHKPTHQKLYESSIARTPVWYTHSNKSYMYHCLSPCSNGKSLFDILQQNLYPRSRKNIFTHEIINPGLHVSTLVLDIDIRPTKEALAVLVLSFVRDLVKLIEIILVLCQLDGQCIHYTFQSQRGHLSSDNAIESQDGNAKYGFHHHVKLPYHTVMVVGLCQQIVQILNNMRFSFSKTLAISCHQEPFDQAIYNSKSFHSIRGPYQSKEDGTGQLVCIYRSDGKPNLSDIPLFHKLVHAPHINPDKPNEYVKCGRVLDKFKNVKLITDDIFLRLLSETSINNYAKTTCKKSIEGIMREINKNCIFFTIDADDTKVEISTKNDIIILENMANELWANVKRRVIQRMVQQLNSSTA